MEKIETMVGKKFEVSLRANPSTGYRWEPHFDSSRISLIDRRYQGEQRVIGGGGWEIFTFVALRIGKTEIKMILKRGWQKGFLKKEVFEILVR